MTECAALAREFGVTPDGDVPALMALIDALPADSTASMQRDVADERRNSRTRTER
jgi:ketopantoate reductase